MVHLARRRGDRVVYAFPYPSSYAEYVVVPASAVVPVPDDIDDQSAAAAFLQGMTAHYLTHSTYPLQAGGTVLIHAAAGGVGSLLTQMARHLGAHVIGTVSTAEKAQLTYESGANEARPQRRLTRRKKTGVTKRCPRQSGST